MRRFWLLVLVACNRGATGADAAPPPPDARPAGPEVVRIESMAVQVPLWPKEAGPPVDEPFVARRLWEGLTQSPLFVVRGTPPGARVKPARLHVTVGVEVQRPAKILRGAVHLQLEWLKGGEDRDLSETDACETELPAPAALPAAAAQAVECAVGRAATGLVGRETVRRGEPAAVAAALDGTDATLRQAAFVAVADHRMSAMVPKLIELLRSEDPMVRDGAIGALVALRDARAIKPLTELGQFNDIDIMRRVIDAIGAIGGEEARAYLELVASGHDVPGIRKLAADALERLERRERR